MNAWQRLHELPDGERRNSDPTSLSGRIERAWGWPGVGVVGAAGGLVVFAALGVMAWGSGLPWIFPSLAPTVVLMLETPLRAQASPRNATVGHLVGIAAGYAMLATFGLTTVGPATVVGVGPRRVAAAALAVALTVLVIDGAGLPHPPAASSTLVVALGVLRTPVALAVMAGAALVTVALCAAVNQLAGVRAPLWSPQQGCCSPRNDPEKTAGTHRSSVHRRAQTPPGRSGQPHDGFAPDSRDDAGTDITDDGAENDQ